MLEIGQNAPEFNLQNTNGDYINLSDLKGKQIILWFYPKASTPG